MLMPLRGKSTPSPLRAHCRTVSHVRGVMKPGVPPSTIETVRIRPAPESLLAI